MIRTVRSCVAAALAVALLADSAVRACAGRKAGRIVCWKDKSGKVVGCGDKVPPEYQDSATRELDSRGVTRNRPNRPRKRQAPGEGAGARQDRRPRRRSARPEAPGHGAARDLRQREGDRPEARPRPARWTCSRAAQGSAQEHDRALQRRQGAQRRRIQGQEDAGSAEGRRDHDRAEGSASSSRSSAKEKEKEEIRQRYADQKKRYLELRGEAPAAAAPPPALQPEGGRPGQADKSQSAQKAARRPRSRSATRSSRGCPRASRRTPTPLPRSNEQRGTGPFLKIRGPRHRPREPKSVSAASVLTRGRHVRQRASVTLRGTVPARRARNPSRLRGDLRREPSRRRPLSGFLGRQLALQESVTCCGLALPLVSFITWPTSELNALSFPRPVVRDLLRVGGDHLVADFLQRAAIGDLLQAPLLDDRVGFHPRPPTSRRTTSPRES